jgi:two-component system, OmpR family, sensor histidine kinase CreC
VDFSLPDGKIRITAAAEGNAVSVTIEDEGRGIPDYALDKIFTKFYSLERPDTGRKGTGLGLAFAEQVVKLHGGTIRIENKTPAGVRVEVLLSND